MKEQEQEQTEMRRQERPIINGNIEEDQRSEDTTDSQVNTRILLFCLSHKEVILINIFLY